MKKTIATYLFLIFISSLFVSVSSCGNRRKEQNNTVKLKKKNDKELKTALFEQDHIPFDFFTVRIGVDFESKVNRNASFSCYVKLNVDSTFGGTIKAGPVIIATYKITQDSIFFVNKHDKCYFAENLTYVSSLFGTTIEYDFFQDLILGLPVGLDDDIKYQQIDSKDSYILSSHKKKDYRKLENDRLNVDEDDMLIRYEMIGEDTRLEKIFVQIPSDTTEITVNYVERKIENEFDVPEETTIQILNPKDTISIRLNYGIIKLNEPKKISVKIPDSYSECK